MNNAGIAVPGPLEHLPIDEFRRQMEVNLVGQVAVTQAFLPLLRTARGRIVNIGSIGGRVALPLLGPVCRVEACDGGHHRLPAPGAAAVGHRRSRSCGPGPIATEIWESGNATADELLERMPEAEEDYGAAIAGARAWAAQRAERGGFPRARSPRWWRMR